MDSDSSEYILHTRYLLAFIYGPVDDNVVAGG